MTDDDTIAVITLDKPPVNAWALEDYVELSRCIATINSSDTVRAAIIRAEGRMFSAGADVKRLANDDAKAGARRRPILRAAMRDLAMCQVPVIAAIHGRAVGVGTGCAASADIIVATPDALFSIPEINVGIVGAGDAMRRLVPEHKARALALTGGSVSGEELYRMGSVEELVERDQLDAAAFAMARRVADKGYLAVRKWKEALTLTDPASSVGAFVEQCLSQELTLLSPTPSVPGQSSTTAARN